MSIPTAPPYPSALLNTQDQTSGILVSLGSLVFNLEGGDANGVEWWLDETSLDAWGTASSTIALTAKPRSRGATTSTPFDGPRHLPMTVWILAPDEASLTAAIDSLNAAASLDLTLMAVNEQGLIRHMYVQREDHVLVTRVGRFSASCSFQLVAPDPLKYGDVVTASTGLPSSSGGITYPVTYPVTYSGVVTSGILIVTNNGNTNAPVWLQVNGPIPAGGWEVTHAGKQKTLSFASSLSLDSGQYITVDMDSREVLAQGQSAASRSGWVTSRGWFDLDPGDNEIAFTATNYSASALLTVTTMSAWE